MRLSITYFYESCLFALNIIDNFISGFMILPPSTEQDNLPKPQFPCYYQPKS